MLSEVDQFSLSDRGLSPIVGGQSKSYAGGYQHDSSLTPPVFTSPHIEIAELKTNPTDNTDSYSFGDFSPIKLVYHSNGTISEALRTDVAVSRPNQRAPVEQAAGILTALQYDSGSVSNPFYVLRSVRQAFQGCKYLLPCLSEQDVCTVNITTVGHILHYRGTSVRPSTALYQDLYQTYLVLTFHSLLTAPPFAFG
jgi:hypothetical protein